MGEGLEVWLEGEKLHKTDFRDVNIIKNSQCRGPLFLTITFELLLTEVGKVRNYTKQTSLVSLYIWASSDTGRNYTKQTSLDYHLSFFWQVEITQNRFLLTIIWASSDRQKLHKTDFSWLSFELLLTGRNYTKQTSPDYHLSFFWQGRNYTKQICLDYHSDKQKLHTQKK